MRRHKNNDVRAPRVASESIFRYTIGVIAFLGFSTANSSWLGVWSYEDCIKTYAVPATASNGAGIAAHACKGIYTDKEDVPAKAADQCILDGIVDAKTQGAAAILVRTCRNARFCPDGGQWHALSQSCDP